MNENVLNNSDTDFIKWEQRKARKARKPAKPGDWAYEIQPDPFFDRSEPVEAPF